MASSREAFSIFSKWKNSQTVLKVTGLTSPGSTHVGHIFHVGDFVEDFELGFVDDVTRNSAALDFKGADFLISDTSLRAMRDDLDDLLFEEVLLM